MSCWACTPQRRIALYGLWEGYGGLASLLPGQPLARLPARAYFVFEGGLDGGQPWLDLADDRPDREVRSAVPDIAHVVVEASSDADEPGLDSGDAAGFPRHLPNLFWPGDRAWCVANEIDFCWTLVGCSQVAADALLADPELESWPVQPGDSVLFHGDRINV